MQGPPELRFERVYIEITNVCNLQCDFCPEVERPSKRMAFDVFHKIIDEVKPYTAEVTFHVMGEPLAHPDFERFADYCQTKGVPIQLTTNGTLLDHRGVDGKTRFEFILSRPVFRQVNFSLQSFTGNQRKTDTEKAACFAGYMNRIFQFARRALVDRPEMYVNFRLWNAGSTEAICTGNKQFLDPIRQEFGFELKHEVDVSFRKSRRIDKRLYMHFDSRFEWPSLNASILHTEGRCHALKSHVAILSDGTVVPCCLDKEAGISLGQITALSEPGTFFSIVRSERALRIREGFDRGELCEKLCQRCQFISRFKPKSQFKKPIHIVAQ